MRKLIVNADDFGLHPAVNLAVEEAYQRGIVRSTSIMAVGEAFEDAVLTAKRNPELGIGVHLALVGARPLSMPSSVGSLITDEGRFLPDYASFIRRYMAGKISPSQVECELNAQIQRVVAAGLSPTHVDSHQHLHVLPGVGRIVLNLARRFGINAVRIPAEPLLFFGGAPVGLGRLLGRTGLSLLARRFRKMAVAKGFIVTDHFFGMLAGGCMTEPRIQNILHRLPAGISELMVHPGESDVDLSAAYPWRYSWQEEFQALAAKGIFDTCDSLGIFLASYRDCQL